MIGLDYPGNPDVLDDLYLIALARGVQEAAHGAGYGLLLNTLPRAGGDIELLREWICGGAVDGVVMALPPGFHIGLLDELASSGVPCVLITQGALPPSSRCSNVVIDLESGAREAVGHLRRLGHERIGHLTPCMDDAVTRTYQRCLNAEGLLDDMLTAIVRPTVDDARSGMHRLLALPHPPTAVFARTDVLAVGALRAARETGARVPQEISVVGHDDLLIAKLCDPPLTTVRVDTGLIGAVATAQILNALDEGTAGADDQAPPTQIVRTELVVRESTARVDMRWAPSERAVIVSGPEKSKEGVSV